MTYLSFFKCVWFILLSSSQVAVALGKFLNSSIEVLNVGGIGLGSSGFQELQGGMMAELKLVKINIRFNLIHTYIYIYSCPVSLVIAHGS